MLLHTITSSKARAALIGAAAVIALGVGTTAYACDGGGFGGFGGLSSMSGMFGGGADDFGDDAGFGDEGFGGGNTCENACGGGAKEAGARPQREMKKRGSKKQGKKQGMKDVAPQAPMPAADSRDPEECMDEDYDNMIQVKADQAAGTFNEGDDDYSDMAGEESMKPAWCNKGAHPNTTTDLPAAQTPQRKKHKKLNKPVNAAPAPVQGNEAQVPSDEPVVQPVAPAPKPVEKPAPAQKPAEPALPHTGVDTQVPLQLAGSLIILGAGATLVARRRRATR